MAFFNALLFHAKIYLNVYLMCVFFFLEYKMKLVNFVCTVRERSFGIANGQDKETCSRLFCFFFARLSRRYTLVHPECLALEMISWEWR